MKPTVFIHTNHKQKIGALVAAYALKRNSTHADQFDVHILDTEKYPFIKKQEGKHYLRDGVKRVWLYEDLQSFTPLRFVPPEYMDYQGRAIVIDPDIFAVADIWDLLSRDMQGKAILCRARSGPKGLIDRCLASSVMLLDCEKLKHWQCETQFNELFESNRDYTKWVCLKMEDPDSIGFFENEWNDFDRFTAQTKLLHNTRRLTQPWKTGLPTDWRPAERFRLFPPLGWLMRARRHFFGEFGLLGNYRAHPDPNQEQLFFGLLKECLEQGIISERQLQQEIERNHVRKDAIQVLEKTTPLLPAPLTIPL